MFDQMTEVKTTDSDYFENKIPFILFHVLCVRVCVCLFCKRNFMITTIVFICHSNCTFLHIDSWHFTGSAPNSLEYFNETMRGFGDGDRNFAFIGIQRFITEELT